jgi:hypothetical protein
MGSLLTEGIDWDVTKQVTETTILEAYKPAWPMRKEDGYNYRRAPCESHRLQGMISDTSSLADQAMHEGLGERTPAGTYMV